MAAAAGCCPDLLYETQTADPVVRLPRDEAPHCSGGEWWYYTGTLAAENGKRYGVQVVVFHYPGWLYLLPVDGWAAHYAVTSEADGTFTYDQVRGWKMRAANRMTENGFDVSASLVALRRSGGRDHISAAMGDGNFALELDLTDVRGAVLYGDGGYVPYGSDLYAFYYSRPRMAASGTLTIDNKTLAVTGDFWFDRQWGRDVDDPSVKWDWFSLRLDDGSDVMLFLFRDGGASMAQGAYIPPAGDSIWLAGSDFTVNPTEWWTSPDTHATYPVAWTISLPAQSLTLAVKAAINNQELDVRATTLNVYWEGLCNVIGTRGDQPVTGTAYVELTNYLP